MKVSVIIPCYNQAHFLGEAIESALAQSRHPYEIIVIDDGSTDKTPEIAKHYPGIRYRYQENKGLSEARNVGFHDSTGDFLVFLDSDDRLPHDSIQTGLAALQNSPEAAFAYGRLRNITIDGTIINVRQEPARTDFYHDLLKTNYIPTPGMVMFRRSTLDKHGLFDPKLNAAEDYDMYLRITRENPVVSHPAITIDRRVHPHAMTLDAARMLRATLIVQGRQWPHARKDDSLRNAFLKGKDFWKEWYGNQLLTQMKIERYFREWRKIAGNILTLLRFHPGLLKKLLAKARQSNHFSFYTSHDYSIVHTMKAKNGDSSHRANHSEKALQIHGVELRNVVDLDTQNNLLKGLLVTIIECENATKGTRVVLDDVPIAGVMISNSLIQAFIPKEKLTGSQTHKIYLLG